MAKYPIRLPTLALTELGWLGVHVCVGVCVFRLGYGIIGRGPIMHIWHNQIGQSILAPTEFLSVNETVWLANATTDDTY